MVETEEKDVKIVYISVRGAHYPSKGFGQTSTREKGDYAVKEHLDDLSSDGVGEL